jgi:hypothetical protein
VLTVQSETLSGTGVCSAAGSGGPFTTATTITGTTQPSGILAGYCYLYTLTGTDNVGNVTAVRTTVVDNSLSFRVTSQPTTASAGTASSVTLTALKNGSTDTTYAGAALTWSGAASSPSGTAPTLPTSPTWTTGAATFTITLVNAQTATLSVTDGTRNVTFAAITVSPGTATKVAWKSPGSSHTPLPSPCLFTCAFGAGFGNSSTFTAYVSITDGQGNSVSGIGTAKTVNLSVSNGTVAPASLTIPAAGPATSTAQFTYTSKSSGPYSDTLTAASTGYTSATATFSQ